MKGTKEMEEQIDTAVKLLCEKVLTPILYMIEYDDKINFICFCDKNIKLNELYSVSTELMEILKRPVEIIDIREFSEADRIEILKTAQLVYSEDPVIEQIFVASMAEDLREVLTEKFSMIDRKEKTGTYFLQ